MSLTGNFLGNIQLIYLMTLVLHCPVDWGCRIYWLHLCRGVRPPHNNNNNECPGYDTKQSEGEILCTYAKLNCLKWNCFDIQTAYWAISLISRVFANSPGDRDSIPGRVIPKTQKMVLDAALLNTKVRIKGKVEQSRERSSPPYTLVS